MEKIDIRLLRCFVLLTRQYLLLDYIVQKRKPEILTAFEFALEQNSQSIENVFAVYDLAFSLVDNIVRYQKIADMLPRFSQKSPEHRLFDSRLSRMKDLRNLFQHLSKDFETEFESPVLGGISWVRGNKNYIAAFNDPADQRGLAGIVYDLKEGRYTKEFCFVHNGIYYDFNEAILGCFEYQEFVETKCKIQSEGGEYKVKDHFIAMAFEFQKRSSTDS